MRRDGPAARQSRPVPRTRSQVSRSRPELRAHTSPETGSPKRNNQGRKPRTTRCVAAMAAGREPALGAHGSVAALGGQRRGIDTCNSRRRLGVSTEEPYGRICEPGSRQQAPPASLGGGGAAGLESESAQPSANDTSPARLALVTAQESVREHLLTSNAQGPAQVSRTSHKSDPDRGRSAGRRALRRAGNLNSVSPSRSRPPLTRELLALFWQYARASLTAVFSLNGACS